MPGRLLITGLCQWLPIYWLGGCAGTKLVYTYCSRHKVMDGNARVRDLAKQEPPFSFSFFGKIQIITRTRAIGRSSQNCSSSFDFAWNGKMEAQWTNYCDGIFRCSDYRIGRDNGLEWMNVILMGSLEWKVKWDTVIHYNPALLAPWEARRSLLIAVGQHPYQTCHIRPIRLFHGFHALKFNKDINGPHFILLSK